ncbi:protein MpWAK [Marchantia polymorpha subsp. ruderalis]|uniref:Protein kinase domain-containing protein n=2 Tax=Marchantia polymorpha TaxID=3197 RepID=A0AAF6AWG3_MARPO|nr:hypothetical protein MARPO_0007s0179 [Marchantia polymorpha]BBN04097.1 hypothetical protein Mp_3g01890 [Marchantia polymorpha subsp. ruderalis]|eukprot:PTQ47783.1 hypothetical protein MARPO_0007s0179 [Marchantia polymorpha]
MTSEDEWDQKSGRWKLRMWWANMKTNRIRFWVALLVLWVLAFLALQNFDNRRCAEKRPATSSSARMLLQSNNSNVPDCQRVCGDVSIPYPFGLSAQCAFNSYFVLECRDDLGPNLKSNRPGRGPWPVLTYIKATSTLQQYWTNNNTITDGYFEVPFLPVTQIYSDHIVVDMTQIKAMGCWATVNASLSLDAQSPYWISQNNVFIVVSCGATGSASGLSLQNLYFSTSCDQIPCSNSIVAAYCNAYDCCITSIDITKELIMSGKGRGFAEFTNCGYSTLLYPGTFALPGPGVGDGTYGVALWYEIQRNATVTNCAEAAKDEDKYECSNNGTCYNQIDGYYCQCERPGYEGDGYTLGTGCSKEINECLKPNNCSSIATCVNTDGSYECKCPDKMEGDGKNRLWVSHATNCTWIDQCKNKTGVCSPDAECFFDTNSGVVNCMCQGGTVGDGLVDGTGCKKTSNLTIIIGVSVGGVVFIIINSILLWCFVRRRRLAFDPAIFSQQELLNEIENKEGAKFCKTFTFNELREATKDFSVELGSGGFGTVFEGTLPDGTKVAVKKAKHGMGETRREAKQFVNEIVILLQLNHRNLVKLLGCCLETRVPVLVYEFVSNGNLDEHIQMKRATEAEGEADDTSDLCHPPLNWTLRLKIAIETAEGLSYLHWGTSPPVYHRDVKCANILLDDAYNVKVADFGLSKLVPLEDTAAYAVPTAIQGTPGYMVSQPRSYVSFKMTVSIMDPGLLDQYELKDKSDVYSYGVLLLVILTGQRPVDLQRQPRDQNLVNKCNRLMTQGLFANIIDPILSEAVESPSTLEAMDAVAKLAIKCVSRDGHDRPTMKEVVSELHTIQRKTETSDSKMVKSLAKKVNISEEFSLVPLADGQWHKSYDISTSISAVGR